MQTPMRHATGAALLLLLLLLLRLLVLRSWEGCSERESALRYRGRKACYEGVAIAVSPS